MGHDAYRHVMASVGGLRDVARRGLGERGRHSDEMIWDLEQLRVRNDEMQQFWLAIDFANRLEGLKTVRAMVGNQDEGGDEGKQDEAMAEGE